MELTGSLFGMLLILLTGGRPSRYLHQEQWDADRLVSYAPGTACIVLSAPHGGLLRPNWIADRRAQGCNAPGGGACYWNVTCPDSACHALLYGDPNTLEIAQGVREALGDDGLLPHLVLNHMDRMKMDPNRGGSSLSEGIQSDPGARKIYESYHGFIRRARDTVRENCNGRGLLFDIHGQHHPQDWTEIGYLLSKSDLNSWSYPTNRTSIRGLVTRLLKVKPEDASPFISGARSFGSLLNSFGYPTVPSESIPKPDLGGYYSGGFITQQYGSVVGGEFDAIQIEISKIIMYATPEARRKFSRHLATAIGIFSRSNGYA